MGRRLLVRHIKRNELVSRSEYRFGKRVHGHENCLPIRSEFFLLHFLSNSGGRLSVVHFFLGFQQIFPAHRKSSQSNVDTGAGLPRRPYPARSASVTLDHRALRSQALYQPIPSHVDRDIQSEIDRGNNQIISARNPSRRHDPFRWQVTHCPDAVQVLIGRKH
jgi:hypothetical protein